jgi:glycosyltransferase involved in cell wall biosynthesis
MRILIAGTTYYPASNGQAIFTVNLAEGLAKRGHEVVVAFPSDQIEPYHAERNGVQLEGIKSLSLNVLHEDAHFSPFPRKSIRRIFKMFRPEIVHIQDHYPLSRIVVLMARHYKIKSVGTNHFMPENLAAYSGWLANIKPLHRWVGWTWMMEVYKRLDIATAQSKGAAELMRKQGLRIPVFPLSCGIDLQRFYPDPHVDRKACRKRYGLDPDRKLFLFVGRVDAEKRLHVMLRAMSQLERDDVQFAIAGRGAALEGLQALAEELNLGERVRFPGFIPAEDLPVLLNSADIFVMPSEAELLSLATLEAMACGRPVLLADAVALPELVDVGVNGYLFRPGDPLDAAKYIERLASELERWPEMGKASLEKAKFHGLENTIRQYEILYKKLLSDAPLTEIL